MKNIRLFTPYVSWRSVLYTLKTLRSGQLAEGPRVKEFEKEFAATFGFERVVTVNSGTAALELAYELAGIQDGDEVITPVLTCTATNLPIIHHRGKVVFADVEKDLNIDVEDVQRKITPKTKALVFVHFGGSNRGLKEMLALAEAHNLILIEDAAQAVGSEFWGKADFTCVSLQAIKALTSGDGGVLICKDEVLDRKARRLRWFGYDRDEKQRTGDMDLKEAGYKYHMNDVSAAIGLGNLRSFGRIQAHQQKLIAEYARGGISASPWFALLLTSSREKLRTYLKERGIETGIYHYRNDKYSIFGASEYGVTVPGRFPTMDEIDSKYVLLPLHMGVSVQDVRRICQTVKDFEAHELR